MGEGVGKTTAAAGLALRAASHGKQVRILGLLKPAVPPEFAALQTLGNVSVTVANPDIPFFFMLSPDQKQARIQETEQAVKSFLVPKAGDFLLVLDEAGGAMENGMLKANDLLFWLSRLPGTTHIALTGRYFPQEILDKADCISEIRCVRHPFDSGVQAQEGLEY